MLIQVVQRRPAQLSVLAIDSAAGGLQLMANILIGLYFTAGGWRNLRIANLAMVLRVFLQQGFIGEKALRQAFRVIQSLNGEDIFYPLSSLFSCASLGGSGLRTARNLVRIDAYRVNLGAEMFAPCLMASAISRYYPGL